MVDLAGKVAIVTGASRGIGAATARHLASCGAKVVLAARNAEALGAVATSIREQGGEVATIAADVAHYEEVAGAVRLSIDTFGGLDILVNNAGLIEPIARIADSDPQEWGRVVDINYKGVYHGLRAAIPEMLARGGGTIVNISSGAATSALEGWSHYSSSKAAVLMLTRCADKEYGAQGIRVVGLSPGTVATDMQVAIKASGINPVSRLDPSVHISPEWVAQAIAWLCTDAGASYAGTDFSLKNEESRRAVGLV
jgi:NAD(P)-dependent dehydrogenase (short-subunit alcohol dehydrogenase family)